MAYIVRSGQYPRARTLRPAHFNDRVYRPGISAWLPLDVHADDDAFVITANVPGYSADEIDVTVLDDVVTITAAHNERETAEENGDGPLALRVERFTGDLKRSLRMPTPLDSDGAEATVDNGVLTVRVPKAEVAKPKAVAVTAH